MKPTPLPPALALAIIFGWQAAGGGKSPTKLCFAKDCGASVDGFNPSR